ncbi:TSUP family transporter [Vibrio sp. S4M6]|uniref:TSUP family transporter n=1 Tax=Vibrio sinus TaxID=2946865 RepID=UPI00202A710A|nr:TSUP family transporter [Vibrio sinus]MCL9781459.1 TSUP family transporter [Vibrio sinus]
MEVTADILIILFLVATAAGFIDAMAGGGGMLTVPALLAVGVPPTQALATNKLQGTFGSFSASWYFVRRGVIRLNDIKVYILWTFVGAALGAELVQVIDVNVLTSLIPALLIAISLYFLFAPKTKVHEGKPRHSDSLLAFLVGGGVGFYDGFFGPGTGSIFTVCFVALANMSIVDATARTKVLNFTSNLAALVFFIVAGLPIWKIGLTMALGNFLGARMGAKMVITKGSKWIRPMVIVMSMLIAAKLLVEQHPQWWRSIF